MLALTVQMYLNFLCIHFELVRLFLHWNVFGKWKDFPKSIFQLICTSWNGYLLIIQQKYGEWQSHVLTQRRMEHHICFNHRKKDEFLVVSVTEGGRGVGSVFQHTSLWKKRSGILLSIHLFPDNFLNILSSFTLICQC